MEENRIPKRLLYINLKSKIPRGIPINTWQDEVKEAGTRVGEKMWKESLYNRE
jgi:hypothetical protein